MKKFIAKFTKSFRYGEKGFTLIELLIVVGVIGILAAVAIPNIGRFMTSGTVGAANAEAQMVNTAVDSCMADAGVMLLDDIAGLTAWTGAAGAVKAGTYDAANYLTLKGGALGGTYKVLTNGTVDGVTYPAGVAAADGGLTWSAANDEWIE